MQVRFLTIDNEQVVNASVAKLPDKFDDVWVVAEERIEVSGANVAVVPDNFDCDATNKGRALEWARRDVPCDREYVLYLDEDSHLMEFSGLPDADIVQLTERPRRTGSLRCFLAELNRIGFQVEQTAFADIDMPLYAWGGGLAVRHAVEDEITWDYPTVIEDTVFLWRARSQLDATYEYVTDRVSNQAPPSLGAMFRQRRRWIAGAREDNDILSLERVLMYGIRDLSWSVTGLIPLVLVVASVPRVEVVFPGAYRLLSVALLVLMYVWIVIGLRVHPQPRRIVVATLVLAPATTVLHSVGALWGLVSQPSTFQVTEKVGGSDEPGDADLPAKTGSDPETEFPDSSPDQSNG